jgi:hypothetical protein
VLKFEDFSVLSGRGVASWSRPVEDPTNIVWKGSKDGELDWRFSLGDIAESDFIGKPVEMLYSIFRLSFIFHLPRYMQYLGLMTMERWVKGPPHRTFIRTDPQCSERTGENGPTPLS